MQQLHLTMLLLFVFRPYHFQKRGGVSSAFALLGSRRSSFQIRTHSQNPGCADIAQPLDPLDLFPLPLAQTETACTPPARTADAPDAPSGHVEAVQGYPQPFITSPPPKELPTYSPGCHNDPDALG